MTADFSDLVKPRPEPSRLILMDDRFTHGGDKVTAMLTEGAVLLHIATETGTASLVLDAEMSTRIARALLDGAQRLDPEEWQLKAAHRMIADAYEPDWQGDFDGEPF